jgi:alkaline phosphatase
MTAATTAWTRREALGLGAAALAGAGLAACGGGGQPRRKVLFFISDGMSLGVPTLADAFSRQVLGQGTLWRQMLSDPGSTLGFFDTASLNSAVTDSAAAATAFASGRRVCNGMLNCYADGTPLRPLCRVLRDHGIPSALVTTARVTHATPAGFFASVSHRNEEEAIALQSLEEGPDLLLGGGARFFYGPDRKDGRDLRADFRARGWRILEDAAALRDWEGRGRTLGLFAEDHFPYALDLRAEAPGPRPPTLAEMTRKALRALASQDRFFMMVESAKVDMAAHANDIAGVLWEQLALDDALREAVEFQKEFPETLIVVSSDHANSNPGLNGMGKGYRESTGCFERVAQAVRTASWIRKTLSLAAEGKPGIGEELVRETVRQASGFAPDAAECRALADRVSQRQVGEWSVQHANFYGLLGQVLGNWNGVGWTGVTHTADWSPLIAAGPGREHFQGLIPNTGFYDRACALFGLNEANPPFTGKVEITVPAGRSSVADPTG